MTEKSIEDRNNIRHYVCTHVLKFPTSDLPWNTGYVKGFLEKLLALETSAKEANEKGLEHAKSFGKWDPYDKEYLEVCVQLSSQAVSGIQSIMNGEKRAVYNDCEQYLIDIFKENDAILLRHYAAPRVKTNADLFENMIRIFRRGSSMMGHEYFVFVESDEKFSDE